MLRAERKSGDWLRRRQFERLNELLRHAFEHVPAYRELWRAHGVGPRDVERLEDVQQLPIVDKDTMRDIGPEQFIDRRRRDDGRLLPRTTSGSSGKPFEFLVDRPYNEWRKAQRLRPYVTNGLKPWHRVLALTWNESQRPLLTRRLGLYAERRVSAARPADELLRTFLDMQPDVITGYPSALGSLAAEYLQAKAAARRPLLVFSDSETLKGGVRARVREAFGVDPIDIYGTMETDNIAFECTAHVGLHVALDSAIVEIVANGSTAPPGSQGEVVATVLQNFAMPFIRYNLHDLGAYAVSPCQCGRTLPRLQSVDGRSDDYVSLPRGRRCSALMLLAQFDALSAWIREYRIVQNAVNDFTLYLRPAGTLSVAVERRIREIVEAISPGARMSLIECREGVPREASGKLRAFVPLASE